MPFGVNTKAIIGSVMGGRVGSLTLVRVTPGTRTPGNLAAGTNPTTASYSVKGYVTDYAQGQINGTLVKVGDRVAVIYGSSLPAGVEPATADKIGDGAKTWTVVRVERHSDGAVFHLQLRGV